MVKELSLIVILAVYFYTEYAHHTQSTKKRTNIRGNRLKKGVYFRGILDIRQVRTKKKRTFTTMPNKVVKYSYFKI